MVIKCLHIKMLAGIFIWANPEYDGNVISTWNIELANLRIGVFFLACCGNNTMSLFSGNRVKSLPEPDFLL